VTLERIGVIRPICVIQNDDGPLQYFYAIGHVAQAEAHQT
jgi:hypothetical protein